METLSAAAHLVFQELPASAARWTLCWPWSAAVDFPQRRVHQFNRLNRRAGDPGERLPAYGFATFDSPRATLISPLLLALAPSSHRLAAYAPAAALATALIVPVALLDWKSQR